MSRPAAALPAGGPGAQALDDPPRLLTLNNDARTVGTYPVAARGQRSGGEEHASAFTVPQMTRPDRFRHTRHEVPRALRSREALESFRAPLIPTACGVRACDSRRCGPSRSRHTTTSARTRHAAAARTTPTTSACEPAGEGRAEGCDALRAQMDSLRYAATRAAEETGRRMVEEANEPDLRDVVTFAARPSTRQVEGGTGPQAQRRGARSENGGSVGGARRARVGGRRHSCTIGKRDVTNVTKAWAPLQGTTDNGGRAARPSNASPWAAAGSTRPGDQGNSAWCRAVSQSPAPRSRPSAPTPTIRACGSNSMWSRVVSQFNFSGPDTRVP